MSAVEYRFIEPLDVLFLRGNKLFGDPGSYGESLVPPWPSVVAGALRSRMLADDGVDLAAFARGDVKHPALGTPKTPGDFAVAAFHLARRHADGRVETLIVPPADLVISEDEDGKIANVRALKPTQPAAGLLASSPFTSLPVLVEDTRGKPASGFWLTETGWKKYLSGQTPHTDDLVKSGALWQIDARVGVGLDAATRRAADGRLFSVQAVAMVKQGHRIGTDKQTDKPIPANYDVGFLAAVTGAVPPKDGSVRLGGDGRAAAVQTLGTALPEPDYNAIASARHCRLVLATPGIFANGWLPDGVTQATDGGYRFDLHGVCGKLVCAAVPRAEVVSGWDLAQWRPKAAQRAAPAGSVYWLDEMDATAGTLRKLAENGLWREPCEDAARRAEGFNRITLAAY
jgi:CRISPR-associated protein Cmr3